MILVINYETKLWICMMLLICSFFNTWLVLSTELIKFIVNCAT
jgi:hypothetical protein